MKLVARKLSPGDDDDNVLRIDVRRNCVLKDALREEKNKKFNTHKHLKVGLLWHTAHAVNIHNAHAGWVVKATSTSQKTQK